MSDSAIPGGQISGWKIGTPFISIITSDWNAVDEPQAYSAGGNVIYWNLCCDRQFGMMDLTLPNTEFAARYNAGIRPPTGALDSNREDIFFNRNLPDLIPGYNVMVYPWANYFSPFSGVFGGRNGSYGWHGDGNPPVPYNGKVYMHRANAIIAFAPPQAAEPINLPPAQTVIVQDDVSPLNVQQLRSQLAAEVQKIIDAGHLRPGFMSSGIFDLRARGTCGDDLVDYWHHPADTTYTLLRALPHLPADMQQQTRAYLQSEFETYPPYQYNHIGWRDGAAREVFDLPPEIEAGRVNHPPETAISGFEGWGVAPYAFYALWKYAEVFGEAQTIFDLSKNNLKPSPLG